MEDTTKAVETKGQTAATDQGVKAPEITAPESQEVDYMKLIDTITEQEKELAKEREEKENYKKGLLKAKGKIPDDSLGEDDSSNIEALIEKKVEEKLLSTKEAKLQEQKDAALKAMAKKLSELSVAVKNRVPAANAATGSNQDRGTVQDNFFSDAQIAALKARGLDPQKVKENMLRQAANPAPVITHITK